MRDEFGNALGGIRLPHHEVATAVNRRENSGPNFCNLQGRHIPFDAATLQALYPTHADYVARVDEVAARNEHDGYVLAPDAAEIRDDARRTAVVPMPDYTVAAIRLTPERVSGGDVVTFTATITNAAAGGGAGPRVRFMLDGVPFGADRAIGALGGGQRVSVTASDPWYVKHQKGLHTIEVRVDVDDAVIEADETNNAATRTFLVEGNKVF